MKHNKHIFKNLKGAITIFLLAISFSGLTQENPWESKPQGENPWLTEEEAKEKKVEIEETKTVAVIDSISKEEIKDGHYATTHSTSTVRLFNINDSIVELNAKSYNYYLSLTRVGKNARKAKSAFTGGIISGSLLSFFALPINLVANSVPTNETKYTINTFIKENPHATKKEIKAIKRGISQRRMGNAIGGVGIGILINAAAILIITFI